MVAMLVKLLLQFWLHQTPLQLPLLRRRWALCCKRFSFNFFTLLFFSFFLCDCRSFQMRDGNFLFRFITACCQLIWGFLKFFVEHLYSFLSFLKIFRLLTCKGLWRYKLHSFNFQDDRSMRGVLAKPLKTFPKSPIRPPGSQFSSARCGRVFEWTLIEVITLQHNKEFVSFIFFYNGFVDV